MSRSILTRRRGVPGSTNTEREVHVRPDEDLRAQVGPSSAVIIDKIFGPLIACEIRVWLDVPRCEWVIERQCIRRKHEAPQGHLMPDGGWSYSYSAGPAIFWEEVARIDGQDSIDFDDF